MKLFFNIFLVNLGENKLTKINFKKTIIKVKIDENNKIYIIQTIIIKSAIIFKLTS